MNIIVIGAGNVGYTVAEVLSHFHNVMVIDTNKTTVETVKSLLNVSVLFEDGLSPKILEDAFSRHKPDYVISTTGRDEDNLFIAMISKYIDKNVKTIARITNSEFMIDTSSTVIDQIICPEKIIADKLAKLALLENAVDFDGIESMGMGLAVFEVTKYHTDIIGKVVINLEIPENCTIVCIERGEDVILDNETVEIHEGDKICVLGTEDSIHEFNQIMGVVREASEFIIIGGGVSGAQTANLLSSRKRYVKVFEPDPERCAVLARELNNAIIVNGSGVDPHLLKSENVGRADVLIANTSTDETNLLACLMGMKLGTTKIISRYSMVEYEDIFEFTGIKSTVGTHRIVANAITKILVSDEQAILKMKREEETFFSATLSEKSKLCGQHMGDIRMIDGARITCIIRGDSKIFPRMDTQFAAGDRLLLFTYKVNINKLEKLLGASIDIGL